ncbi:GGDEF domain-containing protein [Acidovorax sp. SRB_14]|uniref:GGDEF domain-containing protein n=1 Tax=unclassified Acidovorax TaxID=2684926 RepID=UPI00145E4AD2|nr:MULTISPECIES: GGDEF domain-containing protein [unclassified Acidovorax]NMM78256.1 GGDEF domain-containing protein [Acidovorax sp. SRB_24]NMM81482.1 GGDEF domain-containing protein [Acidovorax sp. SRB_14]NMM92168.1 GGDEF domain-containing protein [Rhodococcus sp. SRB_17]
MTADVPTLLLMVIVSSVVMAAALLVLGWGRRQDGLQLWAAALLVSAVGYALYLLRGRIPDAWSVVLANALLSATLSGLLAAVHRFQDRPQRGAVLVVPPVATALLMALFQDSFALRVAVSAALMAAQVLWVLHALQAPGTAGRGARLLRAGLALEAAVLLLRSAWAAAFAGEGATLLQSHAVHTLTFMTAFIALLVTSMGFVFMGKDRADGINRRLAAQDELTGVANRRAIIAALDRDVARAQRTREPMALMMLDVDHFKQVNDRHGHLAGDAVLRTVAGVLRQRVRAQDIIGRYGGEEFLVVLPDTTQEGAHDLALQLCEAVQAAPCQWDGVPIPVTVSIGVVGGRLAASDHWDLLVHAADSALYRAKQGGRNRVGLAPGVERVVRRADAADCPTTFPSLL